MEELLKKHKQLLLATLSAVILVGSGIALGIGIAETQRGVPPSELLGIRRSNPATSGEPARAKLPDKVNINIANMQELELLPGVSSAKAQAIVDYRTKHGPFKTADEIQNVFGIGPKIFERLKELIIVN